MTSHRSREGSRSFQSHISERDIYEAMKDIPGYLDITPGDFRELYRLAYRHAINRIRSGLKSKHIMTKNVISVGRDLPLREVAKTMAGNRVSGVPVIDEKGGVVGVISEKDFLFRMGAGKAKHFMDIVVQCLRGEKCVAIPVRELKAEDIMSSPAITVREDATVMEIAHIFAEKNINRVPVMDPNGHLVGIVSREDVVHGSVITPPTTGEP